MRRSCFVIMPIGDQQFDGKRFTASELRDRYDDLVKEALLIADAELEITRADDVAMPGTITTDILTRLMHSDFVVADISFPNPNVFYELGLRQACRTGTILIKDASIKELPFDLSHQRFIPYSATPTGLKELAQKFKEYFEYSTRHATSPDNHFLELAQFTKYEYPIYKDEQKESLEYSAIMAMLESPDLIDLFARRDKVDQSEVLSALARNPKVAGVFAKALTESGQISFRSQQAAKSDSNRAQRRLSQKKKKSK